MKLAGLTALVTGASSGIGRSMVLALARRRVRVLATGLEAGGLAEVARLSGADVLAADLGDDDGLARVLEWAGGVDVLINNAGFGWYGPLRAIEAGRTAEMLRVNLVAPIRLTAALAPAMVDRGRGHIVNIASIAGYLGVPQEAGYCASKAGLIAFSESIRGELAGTGVGVTVVVLAAVDTAFFVREGRAYARRRPRLLDPDRVAETIVAAVERGRPEVFVPRWLVIPARLHGGAPRLFARLTSRAW